MPSCMLLCGSPCCALHVLPNSKVMPAPCAGVNSSSRRAYLVTGFLIVRHKQEVSIAVRVKLRLKLKGLQGGHMLGYCVVACDSGGSLCCVHHIGGPFICRYQSSLLCWQCCLPYLVCPKVVTMTELNNAQYELLLVRHCLQHRPQLGTCGVRADMPFPRPLLCCHPDHSARLRAACCHLAVCAGYATAREQRPLRINERAGPAQVRPVLKACAVPDVRTCCDFSHPVLADANAAVPAFLTGPGSRI